ncbi:hypothetical protein G9A89_000651 [Geosiphon pyriformis]|nr:hypothetical protein G9A89_000651 [Geosiphon pyriformis]
MALLIDFEKEKPKPTWEAYQLIYVNCDKKLLSMGVCCGDNEEYSTTTKFYCRPCILEHFGRPECIGKWDSQPCLACGETLLDKRIWNDIPGHGGINWVRKGTPIEAAWRRAIQRLDSCYPHDDDKLWQMASAKIESVLSEEIRVIKNNPPKSIKLDWDTEPVINSLEPEEFHEHYQNLAPTREEQEQWLAQLNTRLCHHCLIPSDFDYCDNCDLIYNPPPCMIYTIPEEKEPISSCTSELELIFNPNSNSNDDDNENTSSSSVQYGNNNDTNSNSDSNSDTKYKQYIAISNLIRELELKWFSNNNKNIRPEHVHNTDAGFDLRYPGKEAIKLEPHLRTCIDLKIALEIPATTIVQLASRSSLAKREINIRGGIIDTGYVENIIAMLQNDSEKAYIVEPNEKIAQAIFLPLVKVAQLVSMRKRKELGITARGI